jgi:putative NIF3 family GTP cyclohydrolase 1 type 2
MFRRSIISPSCTSTVLSRHQAELNSSQIFRALKSLTLSDPLQASLLKLSAHGISVFSPHTSLDATPNGINTWIVKPFLPLSESSEPLTKSHTIEGFEGAGMGKIVRLKEGLGVMDIVKMVKDHLEIDHGMLLL